MLQKPHFTDMGTEAWTRDFYKVSSHVLIKHGAWGDLGDWILGSVHLLSTLLPPSEDSSHRHTQTQKYKNASRFRPPGLFEPNLFDKLLHHHLSNWWTKGTSSLWESTYTSSSPWEPYQLPTPSPSPPKPNSSWEGLLPHCLATHPAGGGSKETRGKSSAQQEKEEGKGPPIHRPLILVPTIPQSA